VAARACKTLWKKHRKPFAIDPKGPAGNVIPALREAGIDVVEPTGETCFDPAPTSTTASSTTGLQHTARPELDAAVEGAKKRNIGDGFAWDRKKGAVISPLYAVTLAPWAALRAASVQVFGGDDLDKCDACGINPHDDPDGEHDHLCWQCRPDEEE
jgi:hypothetical protein